MVTDALPLRIFLASPGDLEDERVAVRDSVAEHKGRRAGKSNVVYEVIEWDRVRGTARRAQEAINELIEESHLMVVLFKSAWGSEPGSPWAIPLGRRRNCSPACLSRTGRAANAGCLGVLYGKSFP